MGWHAFQAGQDEYILRSRRETVAMRAEPMKGLLMQQLMPVLAKALVEATEEQAADPVQFVAHKLLQVMIVKHVEHHTVHNSGSKVGMQSSK